MPLAASLSSLTSVLTEALVQLDFQLPPTKNLRSAAAAAAATTTAAERDEEERWNRPRADDDGDEIIDALSDEEEAAAPELPRAHSEGCCAAIAGARAAAIRQGMTMLVGGKERVGELRERKKKREWEKKKSPLFFRKKILGSRSLCSLSK